MTDTEQDLDLYDEASDAFPSKFDLKERLVAIWTTGKVGQRRSAEGKAYEWVETITLVLDDGPNGYQETRPDDNGDMSENLVPSVDVDGPQRLDNFQWSAGGLVARLKPRAAAKATKPMLGRINSQRNKVKGRAASWSIASPTDEDKAIAGRWSKEIRAVTTDVEKLLNGDDSDAAFD